MLNPFRRLTKWNGSPCDDLSCFVPLKSLRIFARPLARQNVASGTVGAGIAVNRVSSPGDRGGLNNPPVRTVAKVGISQTRTVVSRPFLFWHAGRHRALAGRPAPTTETLTTQDRQAGSAGARIRAPRARLGADRAETPMPQAFSLRVNVANKQSTISLRDLKRRAHPCGSSGLAR